MDLTKLFIVGFTSLYANHIAAADLGCKPFYQQPKNVLQQVMFFSADNLIERHSVEIPVTHAGVAKGIGYQTWEFNLYQDNKLFVKCFYKDSTILIKHLPNGIRLCTLKIMHNRWPNTAKLTCAKNNEPLKRRK